MPTKKSSGEQRKAPVLRKGGGGRNAGGAVSHDPPGDGSQSAISHDAAQQLATGLGWFSIALGVAEIAAPGALARTLGMRGSERLIQAYGVREAATGIGILSSRDPAPWIWGRVGGDALDVATLGPHLRRDNPKRPNVGLAIASVLGVTALDLICAASLYSQDGRQPQRTPLRDYRDRSGFPRPPREMRGAARDFDVQADMRTPEPLRPYAH
jgi:hypothetical protein